MNDVCVAAQSQLQSSIKLSSGEGRSVATADPAEVVRYSSNGTAVGQDIQSPEEEARAVAIRAPARVKRATGSPADVLRALENRHRWLLFAQHCYTCSRNEQGCELGKLCTYGKKTLKHVAQCRRDDCTYPRCALLKPLLQHSRKCQSSTCAICVPVWNYIQRDLQQQQQQGTQEAQPKLWGGSPSPPALPQQQQRAPASAAQQDVHPQFWTLPPGPSAGPAMPSVRGAEQLGAADPCDGPGTTRAQAASQPSSSACGTSRPVSGPGDNAEVRPSGATTAAIAGSAAANGAGNMAGGGPHGSLGDGKPPAGKHQPQHPAQPRQSPDSLQPLTLHPQGQVRPLTSQQQLSQQHLLPTQLKQGQQQQSAQQQTPPLLPPPQQPSVSALGSAPAFNALSGAQQFLGVAPGTFSPYPLPPYNGSLPTPPLLGGSPPDTPSDRPLPLPRAGVTITATPPQPIPVPVLSCTPMRPPHAAAPATQPPLVHTYPPAASLGHFFSHLQQHAPLQQQPGSAAATVAAAHWLPLPGMTALPGAPAARGGTVIAANGTNGTDCGGGGGGGPGLLVAAGTTAPSAAGNPPPSAAALWHSQGQLRGGPVALYGIPSDALRPAGLGGLVPAGSVQPADRYGHPYTLAGMSGAGGLPAAGGALAMAAGPLLLWPGHNQPSAGAMAAAAAAATAAAATSAATAAAEAGGAQRHGTAELAKPFPVVGHGGSRLNAGTQSLSGGGGGGTVAAAAVPGLPSGASTAIVPTAHHMTPAPHTLLYGPAALAAGSAAGAGGSMSATTAAGSNGGGGGSASGGSEASAGPTLWSYLLRPQMPPALSLASPGGTRWLEPRLRCRTAGCGW